MRVELHINGALVVELQPENDIERLMLSQMADGAERGKNVALTRTEDGATLVSVLKG